MEGFEIWPFLFDYVVSYTHYKLMSVVRIWLDVVTTFNFEFLVKFCSDPLDRWI